MVGVWAPALAWAKRHAMGEDTRAARREGESIINVLLILLCLVPPFLAVLFKAGPSLKAVWPFLLQLCGHVPGVIYGNPQIVKD